jgi:hypothetical protein
MVPYIVIPFDGPDEEDDDPAIPEHPAQSVKAASSAAKANLNMVFPWGKASIRESSF